MPLTSLAVRPRTPPAVAAGLLAALLAGCGSASPTTTTTNAAAGSPRQLAAAAFKHSACMRSHGVPSFPDPQVSTSANAVGIRMVVPRSLAESPQFKRAQNACRGILPEPGAGGAGPSAAQRAVRKQDLVRFAACMRHHGVSDFPDPTSQGELSLQMVTAAGVDIHSPAFLATAKACVADAGGVVRLSDVERAVRGGP